MSNSLPYSFQPWTAVDKLRAMRLLAEAAGTIEFLRSLAGTPAGQGALDDINAALGMTDAEQLTGVTQ